MTVYPTFLFLAASYLDLFLLLVKVCRNFLCPAVTSWDLFQEKIFLLVAAYPPFLRQLMSSLCLSQADNLPLEEICPAFLSCLAMASLNLFQAHFWVVVECPLGEAFEVADFLVHRLDSLNPL